MESIPMSSESLRQRGKARRQADIVAAAADLWRARGVGNVSLNQIAAAAEVAPQTVYNLVGGLEAISFAVIELALARLDGVLASSAETGVALALEAARVSAGLYIADPGLYRQLLVRVPQVLFDGTHLGRDLAQITIRAMVQAAAAGEISARIDPDRLGRTIYINYLGALYDWACGDAADADFLRAAEIAVLAPVVACMPPEASASDAGRSGPAARLFALLAPPA
ncbi:TetR family transcriptional regulator [Tistrella mobilis]|uniref:TetR family transcriptional regulator n=2 Tax=Tistrella mobilis TaxID=171437 RepID=A0A162LNA0_9PROT|nr:TetR family transcriptional regulator [Tistrella mobilis]